MDHIEGGEVGTCGKDEEATCARRSVMTVLDGWGDRFERFVSTPTVIVVGGTV